MNKTVESVSAFGPIEADVESDLSALGEQIVQYRRQKKLSQKDLASLIEVTPVYMCRIESGKQIPSKDLLKKLSAYLGIPYDQLLALAGYNDLSPIWELYTTDGEVLDPKSIVDSIYKADSNLIDFFRDFDEIGTPDNIQVLKMLLLAMRKEANTKRLDKRKIAPTDKLFGEVFFSLKNYILSLLTPLIGNPTR